MLTPYYFPLTAALCCLLFTTSVGATDLALPDLFAQFDGLSAWPAAAPTCSVDSLPPGRHMVSSYRNGSSTKVTVENGQIQSLEIDGKIIPSTEYDDYQDEVERMLGTSEGNSFRNDRQPLEWMDENQLDRRLEGYEERFERMGESWEDVGSMFEKMAERLGSRFEAMFDMEASDNLFRFEFRGDGDGQYFLDVDSLPTGVRPSFPQMKGMDEEPSAEDEIRDMETMIEQLERRKAEMKRRLDDQQNEGNRPEEDMESIRQDADRIRQSADQIRREADLIRQDADQIRRDAEIVGDKMNVDIGELVKQLREEGLTDTSDSVNSIKLTNDTLKINGKQASDEAHARFLELYQAETGSKLRGKFTVEIKQ
jgi:hypothetical protein